VTAVIVGAYEDAAAAIAALAPAGGKRRAAVLPRAAVDDEARVRLRQAQVECLSTLEGGDLPAARGLAAALAEAEGWERADGAASSAGQSEPGDVIGWYEVRIGSGASPPTGPSPGCTARAATSPRSICWGRRGSTRRAATCSIAGSWTRAWRSARSSTWWSAPSRRRSAWCGAGECFGQDRYVVLRKGVRTTCRAIRAPLVEEASSITTAGAQALVLDPLDSSLLEGRRVLLVDDVIATGGTARAACRLLERAGARVTAAATVLLKGPEPDLPRLMVLARPLL
jgi:hypothetical protein